MKTYDRSDNTTIFEAKVIGSSACVRIFGRYYCSLKAFNPTHLVSVGTVQGGEEGVLLNPVPTR